MLKRIRCLNSDSGRRGGGQAGLGGPLQQGPRGRVEPGPEVGAGGDGRMVGGPVDVAEQLVHGLGIGAQLGGQLGLGRGPAEPAGQLLARLLEPPGPRADRAAGPVGVAQLVEQRPRIRVAAWRSKLAPRSGSQLRAAWARPSKAAEERLSRLTWAGSRRASSRAAEVARWRWARTRASSLAWRSGVIAEVSTTLRGCLITRLEGHARPCELVRRPHPAFRCSLQTCPG